MDEIVMPPVLTLNKSEYPKATLEGIGLLLMAVNARGTCTDDEEGGRYIFEFEDDASYTMVRKLVESGALLEMATAIEDLEEPLRILREAEAPAHHIVLKPEI